MKYGLIGEHLEHSWSKPIHESFGLYEYEIHEVMPAELEGFICAKDYLGINVTIPYKRDVVPFMDELGPEVCKTKSVNTVINRNGKLIGRNTDVTGFVYMMKKGGIDCAGKKALILGTGGASGAVAAGLSILGASEIILVSRMAKKESDYIITYEQAVREYNDCQIIVNTTPVGMYPNTENSPINLAPFKEVKAVADIVYNPYVTRFLAQAKNLGIKTASGLDMLIGQAVDAAGYFLDIETDEGMYEKAYEAIRPLIG